MRRTSGRLGMLVALMGLWIGCSVCRGDGCALEWSTFLGGSNWDEGYGIAVDASGCAYVTGSTISSDFPTTPGAFDTSYDGSDAFVSKLNSTGSALVYSTFLGGGGVEFDRTGIAVDDSGCAYVTGSSSSVDFPTTAGAFDTSSNGFDNAFVSKLNSTGGVRGGDGGR